MYSIDKQFLEDRQNRKNQAERKKECYCQKKTGNKIGRKKEGMLLSEKTGNKIGRKPGKKGGEKNKKRK